MGCLILIQRPGESRMWQNICVLNQEEEPQTCRIRHKKQIASSSEDEAVIPAQKEDAFRKPPTRSMNESVEDSALSFNRTAADEKNYDEEIAVEMLLMDSEGEFQQKDSEDDLPLSMLCTTLEKQVKEKS
ncbi:hypothetical protein JTB14_027855 [Gonioctena quinquepunctata]|nr:hypothetical protein JTB14_027855 [Gonioctena quinquepunctata]